MTTDRGSLHTDFRTSIDAFNESISLEAADLRRTGENLIAIAETMSAHQRFGQLSQGRSSALLSDVQLANVASMLYQARRKRDSYMPAELFADPAWDMLLDLFAAGAHARQITVSSLCIASSVPATTALRWIATLEEAQLVERIPIEHDRRSSEVRLTIRGYEAMRQCLIDWVPLTVL